MKTVRITSKINGFKRSLKENNERKMAFFCRPQDRYKGKFILKSHINQNSNSDIFQTLNRVASGPGWSSEEKGQFFWFVKKCINLTFKVNFQSPNFESQFSKSKIIWFFLQLKLPINWGEHFLLLTLFHNFHFRNTIFRRSKFSF